MRYPAEATDTTTADGRLVFHVFATFAEFERSIIRERTAAGLEAARGGDDDEAGGDEAEAGPGVDGVQHDLEEDEEEGGAPEPGHGGLAAGFRCVD